MNALRDRLPSGRLVLQWMRDGLRVLFTQGPGAFASAAQGALQRQFGTLRAPRAEPADALASQPPMACWYLESPDIAHPPASAETFELRGWVAAPRPLEAIGFVEADCARLLPIARVPRPDITAMYGLPATGFTASCRYEQVRDLGAATLRLRIGSREQDIVVPFYRPPLAMQALKSAKLDRVRAIARCPRCGSESFESAPGALSCRGCATAFPADEARIDFLTPELRASSGIVATENVSSNGYDGEALNLIHRLRDGLILDCGAGSRDRYFPNVVNYEIVPYATTDVLGVGEKLPFRDASFDAVFSFAVLEHVKDPFACGRELLRVLKPGGTLYCQVPFLQPVHGFPHHYYNMTLTGMRNLFGDAIRVEREGPFLFGQPVFALSWMLNRYMEGLGPREREEFGRMRVEELLQPGDKYLGAAFVTSLSPAARVELSCCNCLVATKVK